MNTRHNVGYRVVDFMMQEQPLRFRRRLFSHALQALDCSVNSEYAILFIRYTGFMNRSGEILPPLMRRIRAVPDDLLVVLDNMDLEPGATRLRKGGGDAGHNGLKSVIFQLGSSDFHRLYIGVGRPAAGTGVVEHVLSDPEGEQAAAVERACRRAAGILMDLRHRSWERVMEELNRRTDNGH